MDGLTDHWIADMYNLVIGQKFKFSCIKKFRFYIGDMYYVHSHRAKDL